MSCSQMVSTTTPSSAHSVLKCFGSLHFRIVSRRRPLSLSLSLYPLMPGSRLSTAQNSTRVKSTQASSACAGNWKRKFISHFFRGVGVSGGGDEVPLWGTCRNRLPAIVALIVLSCWFFGKFVISKVLIVRPAAAAPLLSYFSYFHLPLIDFTSSKLT